MGVLRQNVVRLNVFIINNIHGGEFKVRSLWESNVTMLRLARSRRKEFLRTTGGQTESDTQVTKVTDRRRRVSLMTVVV